MTAHADAGFGSSASPNRVYPAAASRESGISDVATSSPPLGGVLLASGETPPTEPDHEAAERSRASAERERRVAADDHGWWPNSDHGPHDSQNGGERNSLRGFLTRPYRARGMMFPPRFAGSEHLTASDLAALHDVVTRAVNRGNWRFVIQFMVASMAFGLFFWLISLLLVVGLLGIFS
ncbi:MAG: hypothetical protein ACOC0P_03015 [Planctomycetota bacterium]